MNDPHVARLIYRIEHSDEFSFEKAESLDEPGPGFRVRIDKGRATVEMIEHFTTEREAREFVHPFMRTWEIDAGLKHSPGVLHFVYEYAEVKDRQPPPGAVTFSGRPLVIRLTLGDITVVSGLGRYPEPPAGFAVPPYVSAMYDSFARYKSERRGLAITAYICLSLLQESSGAEKNKRTAAAEKYGIERSVLDVLGMLSDEKGGPLHARKAKGLGTDYTPQEIAWLEAVIKALIRRAGEVSHDATAVREAITWEHLPELPEASKKVARRGSSAR